MQPDELRVRVHEEDALTLSVDAARTSDVDYGPAWSLLSVAWGSKPDIFEAALWIDDCLPENGNRDPYGARAGAAMIEHGVRGTAGAAPLLAWGNPGAEYPGAVTFESVCSESDAPSYTRLTDAEIGDRLYEAWRIANRAHKGRPADYPERRTSLSGMRGKIGLALRDGQWHAARGSALSTWIAKREDDAGLRGEAGIESLSQEAMRLLGVPSAATRSRVFGDQQCVMSERADRCVDPKSGQVKAIHQEDFAQATAWPGGQKYEGGTKQEPRWPTAYGLLRAHAAPGEWEGESDRLTRMLAAAWMLGHTDLHRRNLGFRHWYSAGARHIRLAPMYDVSSGVGTRLDQTLAIGIARQRRLSEIGIRQWLTHARECGLDPDRTLAIVRDTAQRTPDAITTARATVRERDENRYQGAVDRRAEALLQYARKRERGFTEEQAQRARKGSAARVLAPSERAAQAAAAKVPLPGERARREAELESGHNQRKPGRGRDDG